MNHASYGCKGYVCPDLPYKTAYPILQPTGRNEPALHDLAHNTRAYPILPPTLQDENAPSTPDVPYNSNLPYRPTYPITYTYHSIVPTYPVILGPDLYLDLPYYPAKTNVPYTLTYPTEPTCPAAGTYPTEPTYPIQRLTL